MADEINILTLNGQILATDNEVLLTPNSVVTHTSQLINDGEDGTSPYATEQYVAENGGKIDSISVNGAEQAITNKNVNIAVPTSTKDLTNQGDGSNSNSPFVNAATLSSNLSPINQNITDIQNLIPNQATTQNQLADKDFVNSSIATNTANFIGTFADVPTLLAYSGTVTNNDYAFVVNSVITDNGNDWANTTDLNNYDKSLLTDFDYAWVVNGSNFDLYRFDFVSQQWGLRVSNTAKADVTLNTQYNRYKASVVNNVVSWTWEYPLNNSSFTAAQWEAINSGATDDLIGQITTNQNAISGIKDGTSINSFGATEH